uniref:ABC transporter domain-containing protein n=1 Tax=Aplanochytrium stocchinoi TaxID=215587 RepID=A0A7S3V235_9STRA
MKKLRTNWEFGLFNQAIVREAPMLVQWILRNEYSKRAFATNESVQADGGQLLNYNQLFLFNATNYTFEAIGTLLASGEQIANISGLIARVAEFDEALLECDRVESTTNEKKQVLTSDTISVEHLDIVSPNGDVLAKDINFCVTPETPLMVTGPNASGKTALFRLLGGLWPVNSNARICLPMVDEKPDVFLVPQKVYMVPGNLADQITYPTRLGGLSEENKCELLDLLKLVGVPYLAERENGWLATMKWEDVLSLGEQQRIGMARLFYHKPKFGVLDECTCAVSVDVEYNLYRRAVELGISCVTISQRLALHEFHSQELRLGENSELSWGLYEIENNQNEALAVDPGSSQNFSKQTSDNRFEAQLDWYKWSGGKTLPTSHMNIML